MSKESAEKRSMEVSASRASGPKRKWLWPVLFAWMSLFALGLIDNSRGPVFPDLLKEFELSDTRGSFFFLISSLASVVHNYTFRRFLAHGSPSRLVGIYTMIMAAGGLLISVAQSYPVMLAACALLGVGFGGLGVGQNAAVQEAPRKYRSRSMGLLHGMYGISSFAAPLLIAGLSVIGWRFALAVVCLPAVLVGFIVIGESLAHRWREKVRAGRPSAFIVPFDGMSPGQGLEPREPEHHESMKLSEAQSQAAGRTAAIVVGLLVVAEISISSRLNLLARREWGVTNESANGWLAAYFAAMTMARFSLGLFPLPVATKSLLKWAAISTVPLLLLAFLPLGLNPELRLMALIAFAFPIALGYPSVMTRIAEIFGSHAQSVTSRCVLYQAGGAMIMHFALGWGADLVGLSLALAVVSVSAALGVVIYLGKLEKNVRFP